MWCFTHPFSLTQEIYLRSRLAKIVTGMKGDDHQT